MDIEAIKGKLTPEEFAQLSAMAESAANTAKMRSELEKSNAALAKAQAESGGATATAKQMQEQINALQERAKQSDAAALQARRENAITKAMEGRKWASPDVSRVFFEQHVKVKGGSVFVVEFEGKELPINDGLAAIVAKHSMLLAPEQPTGIPSYAPPTGAGSKSQDNAVNLTPSWIKSKGKK